MKLYFKYGAMNSGKTMEILRTAHNYEENNFKVIVVKPFCDKKGKDLIISRVGCSRKVDFLLKENEYVSTLIANLKTDVILVDEAEFLSRDQINDLWLLTKMNNIVVFCYGLKSDFKTNSFPGSIRLFELADKIEEITTLCECGNKAMFNLRKINGIPVFEGDKIAIDGFSNVTYSPVCGECYIKKFNEAKEKGITKQKKIFEEEK